MIKKLLLKLWIAFVLCLVAVPCYIFTVKINLWNLYGTLPSLSVLENPHSDVASELYAADGVLLGKYFRYNRSSVRYDEISPHFIQALLATEDYQFEKHAGLYFKGIARAFILSTLLRRNKGGGSTLTQQLAKNLFKTRSEQYQGRLACLPLIRMVVLKTKEWLVAIQLERSYTKQEILTMYLNTVSFGSNAYGLKVAAKTFFNTTPDLLQLEQAALLVGLLKAPSHFSPITYPTRAWQRRNVVLHQLYKHQLITQEVYEATKQLPLGLAYQVENHTIGLATYFRTVVRNFLLKWTQERGYDLFADGLKIYTTLDSRVQQHAEAAVAEHMKILQQQFEQHWGPLPPWVDQQGREIPHFIEKAAQKTPWYRSLVEKYGDDLTAIEREMHTPRPMKLFSWEGEIDTVISYMDALKYTKRLLQAGLMAMDPYTGYIKAWVGGINYKHFQYDHVMQGKRQPGSAFKPIIYAAALDNGYTPVDEVVDAPVTFRIPGDNSWTPRNASNTYTGKKMTLRQAMAKSVNSITAYLMKQLGPELVVAYAQKLGIQGPLDPVPALCLGSGDVSIYELVGAYSTFMNHGIWTEPFFITRIEDKNGRVLQEFFPLKKEAISEKTAYWMLYMLKGAVEERGTFYGISNALKEDNELGGKTGTTSNHSDGWTVGLVNDLCTGIWVGGEDRCIHFRTLDRGQGAVTARPIWEKFMLKLYQDPNLPYEKGPFPPPPETLTVTMPKAEAIPNPPTQDTLVTQEVHKIL